MNPDFQSLWGPMFGPPMPDPDWSQFGTGMEPPPQDWMPPQGPPPSMMMPEMNSMPPPAPMPAYWPAPVMDPRAREMADVLAAFGRVGAA